jgi:hypothetical protein
MEKITLTVPASRALSGRALAGVVGSGDMEVLFTAEPGQTLTIDITTSVDNSRVAGRRCSTVCKPSAACLQEADHPRFRRDAGRGAHSYRTGF